MDKNLSFSYNLSILRYVTIFAIVCGSMLSVEIYGISVPKMGIIPLYIALILTEYGSWKASLNKSGILLLIFFIVACISSVRGLLQSGMGIYNNYYSILRNGLISYAVIYIPLFLIISAKSEECKTCLYRYMVDGIIIASWLHCVWAVIEIIVYAINGTDINTIIFHDIFKDSIRGISYYFDWSSGQKMIRAAGLGHDPAYLGQILLFAFIFNKKKISRMVYFLFSIVIYSRSAMIAIIASFLIEQFMMGKVDGNMIKKILKIVGILLLASVLFIFIVNSSSIASEYFFHAFNRIGLSQKTISNSQHLGYIFLSPRIFVEELSIVEKLIGIGPRIEGLAMVRNNSFVGLLNASNQIRNPARAIESDFGELLFGLGIIGFIVYYYLLLTSAKKYNYDIKIFCLSVIVFGFMYNISLNTLSTLVFIILFNIDSNTSFYGKEMFERGFDSLEEAVL